MRKLILSGLSLVCLTWAAQAADPTPVPPNPDATQTETPPDNPAGNPDNLDKALSDAESQDAGSKCSVASVSGDYGLQMQGFRTVGRRLQPFASVRTANFDGQGHTTGKGLAIINGKAQSYSIDGSYTVNDDCSITIDASQSIGGSKPEPYTQFGVLVNGADEIIVMQTNGGRGQFGRYEKY